MACRIDNRFEIVQDVFVRLWEHPDRFDVSRGTLRSFLLSMTHSRAVERVRSEASQQRRRSELERQPQRTADDPARLLETQQAQDAVRAALAELPDAQRRPIEMAYFDGYTQSEIAVALDIPLGTVKTRTSRGMHRLAALLENTRDHL